MGKSEAECWNDAKFAAKYNPCMTCESKGITVEQPEQGKEHYRKCGTCGKVVHPGAWPDHKRFHEMRKFEWETRRM